MSLRYFETPVLERTEYTVVVAASDAARAREIIGTLPVSHSDDDETPPAPPLEDP
jgi:hypothetical protein